MVTTETLSATTDGQGDAILSTPPAEKPFATFFIEGCSVAGLNKTYEVTGSIKTSSVAGATWKYTHTDTTAQNTLKFGGQKAGIEGEFTIKGKKASDPLPFTPISQTTIP